MRDLSSTGTPYPGSRLGLPADGPRSVASWGRRVLALVVDWSAGYPEVVRVGAGDPSRFE